MGCSPQCRQYSVSFETPPPPASRIGGLRWGGYDVIISSAAFRHSGEWLYSSLKVGLANAMLAQRNVQCNVGAHRET